MFYISCIMSIALNPVLAPYKFGLSENVIKIPKEHIESFRWHDSTAYRIKLGYTVVYFPVSSCTLIKTYK